jgi:hypothetical protein
MADKVVAVVRTTKNWMVLCEVDGIRCHRRYYYKKDAIRLKEALDAVTAKGGRFLDTYGSNFFQTFREGQ